MVVSMVTATRIVTDMCCYQNMGDFRFIFKLPNEHLGKSFQKML